MADELQLLIDRLAQLAQDELDHETFYRAALQHVRDSSGASQASAWKRQGDRWTSLVGGAATNKNNSAPPSSLSAALRDTVLRGEPREWVDSADERSPHLLAPVATGGGEVVVDLAMPASSSAEQRAGALRLLAITADLAASHHRDEELRRLRAEQSWRRRCEDFSTAAHRSLDLDATAFALVNEGRDLIGCERLSLVVEQGGRFRLRAVSGQSVIERRAVAVRLLERFANVVLRAGERWAWWGEGTSLPPQVEKALHLYIDQSHARTMIIEPLRAQPRQDDRGAGEGPVLAGFVAEWFSKPADEAGVEQRLSAAALHGSSAVSNALQHHRVFLLPLWRFLGSAFSIFQGRALIKTMFALLVIGAIVATLVLAPADFRLSAEGALQPQQRHHVFAAMGGVISRLKAQHGQSVDEGEVLAEMENVELDERLEKIVGEMQTYAKKLEARKAMRVALARQTDRDRTLLDQYVAEEEEYRVWVESLEKQRSLIDQQRENLKIVSPHAGRVITWDLAKRLQARPVQKGELLMTVANVDGPWVLELLLPGRSVGHLLRAQEELKPELDVEFLVLTDPGVSCRGRVLQVSQAAQLDARHGHGVRVIVAIDPSTTPPLKPGAAVVARIHCGHRSLGFVWLHDVWEFVQTKILFPL